MKRAQALSGLVSLLSIAAVIASSTGCEEEKVESSSATQPSAQAKAALTPSALPTPTPAVEEDKAEEKEDAIECPEPPDVKFVDPELEAEVRKKIEKPEGDLTLADLKKVRSVNLTQTKVRRLDPCIFPLLTELRDLYLGPGGLDDLSPIAGLTKLVNLRAALNKVKDITPLKDLTKLDRLDLGNTKVTDLTALENMKELTELQLDSTPVSDLTPLAGLTKLEKLSLQKTEIKDVSPLKGLTNLKMLYVQNTPLPDTFALAPLRKKGLQVFED